MKRLQCESWKSIDGFIGEGADVAQSYSMTSTIKVSLCALMCHIG